MLPLWTQITQALRLLFKIDLKYRILNPARPNAVNKLSQNLGIQRHTESVSESDVHSTHDCRAQHDPEASQHGHDSRWPAQAISWSFIHGSADIAPQADYSGTSQFPVILFHYKLGAQFCVLRKWKTPGAEMSICRILAAVVGRKTRATFKRWKPCS